MNHLRYFFAAKTSLTIGAVFALNSFMFSNWVTRIPHVKAALDLSESMLGLALLGAPVGALCIMPLAGKIIDRFGLGPTTFWSSVFHILSLVGLALASSFWSLTAALFYFGFSNSIMDISMNASAAQVERDMRKPIMATCHGMWSIGAVLGSLSGSLLTGFSLAVDLHLFIIAGLTMGFIWLNQSTISSYREPKSSANKTFAFPTGLLLVLAFMAFCIMLSEGAIADWSAVYMKESLLANPFLVGLAYGGFSLTMAIGRLLGDSIIPKIGRGNMIKWGGFISAIGLSIAIFIPHPVVAIVGFSITGIGYSCIVPVLFIAAANQPGYTSGTGIAAVTTLGYTGFLIGPPIIGFLADGFGLGVGLGFVLFCSVMVAVLSITLKFK